MSREHTSVWQATVCAVSATPRADAEQNEDAHATLGTGGGEPRGVVLADGLGSYSHARQAARLAADGAAAWLRESTEPATPGGMARLFGDVHSQLRACARLASRGAEPAPRSFGTTLLLALDTGTDVLAAYAGNGAIWHIRGNLDAFAAERLPWSAVNLLNPHSIPRGGREALYTLLDAADECGPVPAVVSVRKDADFGDIFLLCTDGIYSADQVTRGTDPDGGLWMGAEATMLAFYQALRDLFAAWDGEGELPLHDAMRAYVDGLRDRGMLEDDATVGMIVTAAALRHQSHVRAAARAPAAIATDEPPNPIAKMGETADDREDGECATSPESPA